MAKKKATIQDIARAGTSVSTVSRVLTGNAPSVTPSAPVRRAIAQLGYRPSLIARGLKMSKTFTIGVVINDITNPFYSMVVKGRKARRKRAATA